MQVRQAVLILQPPKIKSFFRGCDLICQEADAACGKRFLFGDHHKVVHDLFQGQAKTIETGSYFSCSYNLLDLNASIPLEIIQKLHSLMNIINLSTVLRSKGV